MEPKAPSEGSHTVRFQGLDLNFRGVGGAPCRPLHARAPTRRHTGGQGGTRGVGRRASGTVCGRRMAASRNKNSPNFVFLSSKNCAGRRSPSRKTSWPGLSRPSAASGALHFRTIWPRHDVDGRHKAGDDEPFFAAHVQAMHSSSVKSGVFAPSRPARVSIFNRFAPSRIQKRVQTALDRAQSARSKRFRAASSRPTRAPQRLHLGKSGLGDQCTELCRL